MYFAGLIRRIFSPGRALRRRQYCGYGKAGQRSMAEKDADQSLISISTPAGSSRLIRASTVFWVGFMMSMRRL